MNAQEFLEELDREKSKKSLESIDNTHKVVDAISRRFRGMKETEYIHDEIVIGSAVSIHELIHELEDYPRRDRLIDLVVKIIQM